MRTISKKIQHQTKKPTQVTQFQTTRALKLVNNNKNTSSLNHLRGLTGTFRSFKSQKNVNQRGFEYSDSFFLKKKRFKSETTSPFFKNDNNKNANTKAFSCSSSFCEKRNLYVATKNLKSLPTNFISLVKKSNNIEKFQTKNFNIINRKNDNFFSKNNNNIELNNERLFAIGKMKKRSSSSLYQNNKTKTTTTIQEENSKSFCITSLNINTSEESIPIYETLDFTDAKTALQMKKTKTLIFNIFMLYFCVLGQKLARFGPKILKLLEYFPPLNRLAYGLVRKTFFRQFCGAETEEKTLKVVSTLSRYQLGSVLDYCIEDQQGNDTAFENNAQYILRTIQLANQHPWIRYSCLKISSIARGELLEKATHLLLFQRGNKKFDVEWNELGWGLYGSKIERYREEPEKFSKEETEEWDRLVERLDRICRAAKSSGNPLLVDAEWTRYQAAIDYLVLLMQKRYNTETAVVMNTYQMYLKESYERLKFDLENAKENGLILGVKLVRGAYLSSENERAKRLGYPSPIYDEIDLTHDAYHRAIQITIRRIDHCQVLIATHKSASVKTAARLMYKQGIPPDHPRIQFAQLFGMAEIISNTLAQKGYKVSKYLPYGPVKEVIPYLARRLEENHDFLGGTRIERSLFRKELYRRFKEREL